MDTTEVRVVMSSSRNSDAGISEYCQHCNRETTHSVQIQLRTESDEENETAMYSREPYRVSECRSCGETDSVRMNNV